MDNVFWVLTWVRPSVHLSGLPIRGEACFYVNTCQVPKPRLVAAGLSPLCAGLQLGPGCDRPVPGSGVSGAGGSFSCGLSVMSFTRRWPLARCLLAAPGRLVLWGCCYRENLIIFKVKFIKSACSFSSGLENITGRPFLLPASPRLLEGVRSTVLCRSLERMLCSF